MKAGNYVINIDNVTFVSLENNKIHFNNKSYIGCTKEEAENLANILITKSEPKWIMPLGSDIEVIKLK